jgi:hypothetical protein
MKSDEELIELMAETAFNTFARRPSAWSRAKERTKIDFRNEAREVLAALRQAGALNGQA